MYYALVKRTNVKTWSGAIPCKKGTSKVAFRKSLRRRIRKGFKLRIITGKKLERYLKNKVYKKKERR